MRTPTPARPSVICPLVTLALALGAAPGGRADEVSLAAARDNTLYVDAEGDVSNGLGQYFFSGRNAQANIRRGVLAFDLSSIPAGSTITGATLRLNLSSGDAVPRVTNLHRLLADWGEGASDAPGSEGQGAPAQPNDATWLFRFFSGSSWASAGGDFDPAISAATPVADLGVYTWTGAGLVADVQAWLDNSATNFGWIVRGDEAVNGSAKRFDSRQSPDAGVWPTLLVTYTPVPAPGAAALFTLAGSSAARRRR